MWYGIATLGLPWWLSGKEPACQCRRHETWAQSLGQEDPLQEGTALPANAGDMRHGLSPWVRKIPCRRAWQPIPVFLLGESHGKRRLVGYSPWGCKESDTTEQLTHSKHHYYYYSFNFSLSVLPCSLCSFCYKITLR